MRLPEEVRKLLALGCVGVAAIMLVAALSAGTTMRFPDIADQPSAEEKLSAFPLPEPADLPSPIASMVASLQEAGKLAKPSARSGMFGTKKLTAPLRTITDISKESMIRVGDAIMRLPKRLMTK